MVHEVSQDEFDKEVLNSQRPVLVDFYADWCQPCKMLSPVIESISHKYGEMLKVVKVNVDKSAEIANKYSINSIPTLIMFKDKKAVKTFVGFKPQPILEKEISEFFS